MSEKTAARKAEKTGGFSRRQKLVLVGIIVLNLCLYGGVWLMSQKSDSGPTTETQAVVAAEQEPLGLRDAYKKALSTALGWQADAQLVGVTASWQVASGESLTLNRSSWAFQFYSPTAEKLSVVTADHSGANPGRMQPINRAPEAVMPDLDLDSDELLLTFLGVGGQDFVNNHPQANIHLQLKAEPTGRALWYVTAVDPVVRQSMMVAIDAHSREVVLREANAGGG
jgi:hypothetical protein